MVSAKSRARWRALDEKESDWSCPGPRGMMVLLLKQVHLQNETGARIQVFYQY